MFTTAAPARTVGASSRETASVVGTSCTAAPALSTCAATTPPVVVMSWFRHRDGLGLPVDHKRPWRPLSLTS